MIFVAAPSPGEAAVAERWQVKRDCGETAVRAAHTGRDNLI